MKLDVAGAIGISFVAKPGYENVAGSMQILTTKPTHEDVVLPRSRSNV